MDRIQENLDEEQFKFKETVKISKVIKILVIAVLTLSVILTLIFSVVYPSIDFLLVIIFFIVDTTILILYINYRKLIIFVNNNKIQLKYGIFNNKSIPIELIEDYEIIKPKFFTFGGVGVRLGLDGSWAYLTDFKTALKITYKEHRTFLFSTRKANEIIYLIKREK